MTSTLPTRPSLAAIVATALVMTACGGSDHAARPTDVTATATDASAALQVTSPPPSSPGPASAPTTEAPARAGADGPWRERVTAACDAVAAALAGIPDNDGTAAGIAAEATAKKAVLASIPSIDFPIEVQSTADLVATNNEEAVVQLDRSIQMAATGDLAAAQRALDEGSDRAPRSATAWAIAGARCGPADPAGVHSADLTVPLEMDSWQIGEGFGSIWVSERLAGRVRRLDPATGAVQATIDIGDMPFRLQPASGSMWVRGADAYFAIDPGTNAVTARLAKADVGPSANRSWAVDGGVWICDGQRLHRYDPTTLEAIAVIELAHDCGTVYATDELVVAWSYNEDAGESGTSAATFIDPAGNAVLATVPLPVDAGGPLVLPHDVFFSAYGGQTGVVIDRATWSVKATPDLGVAQGGNGQPASDGRSIFIPAFDEQSVVTVDAATFAPTGVLGVLGANALLVHDGDLWVASGRVDAVQRFDLPRSQ